jgi:hypothetical protein
VSIFDEVYSKVDRRAEIGIVVDLNLVGDTARVAHRSPNERQVLTFVIVPFEGEMSDGAGGAAVST